MTRSATTAAGRDKRRPTASYRLRDLDDRRRFGRVGGVIGDGYHALLTESWPQLIGTIALIFVLVNVAFAVGYWAQPGALAESNGSFAEAFFFSVQTMGTVGYGHLFPATILANVLATVEIFIGLLGLALVTGIVFSKFARPTARILFSRVAVVTPWNGVPSLMFRMANERGNEIAEAQIHVALTRKEETAEGDTFRRFHDLELMRRLNPIFRYTWTAIHPITAESPLHGATHEDLVASDTIIVVSVMGLDETYAQTVYARWSYAPSDVVWGARFVDVLLPQGDGTLRIDYPRFHDVTPFPER